MKAADLSLTELLTNSFSFNNNEGKVMFKGRRTLLMGADATGTLRKDLISVLGYNRAKGFLLRHGWNCGVNDAEYTKDLFPWKDDMEWLRAAPKIHTIEGDGRAEPIEIRANRETGEFYSEGYWYHSYEAEQHIKHFGLHHEPVCSMLIGYAGGYGSYFMGKRVIFKEVECVGKGDPYCRYIGKTVEEWGHEIKDVLPLYEEEQLGMELDQAYLRIEQQKEDLLKALQISEKLQHSLIKSGELSSIINILGQNLQNAVAYEDHRFKLLEEYGTIPNHDMKKFIEYYDRKHDPFIRKLLIEKRTVELSIPDEFGWRHRRLITPVLLNNEVHGFLSILKEDEDFSEMERIALEGTASFCAIHLLHERSIIEAGQRVKGEFINELLLESSNKEDLLYQMKLMGYDLTKPYYVYVFKILQDGQIQQTEFDWVEVRESLAASLLKQLDVYGMKCLVSSRIDQIIALIPRQLLDQTKLGAKPFGELLVNIIRSQFSDYRFVLGISTVTQGLDEFRKKYEEANKSIEMASSSKGNSQVVAFEELGFLGILLHAKDREQLEDFAMNLLKELVDYDRENKSEMLKTLYIYLENQGNIHQTAREMMISVGGLRYRLKRIEEISRINLGNEKQLFDIQLALKILLFIGVFNTVNGSQ